MPQIKPFFFDIDSDEIAYFKEESEKILRSGVLILGPYTSNFEKNFADFVDTQHAVAVNSGSTALEILLRIKQVENRVVLVPTNTNFATVAAILRAGGHVAYLDMDPKTFAPTLAMVKTALEENPRAAGVLWVHIGGIISPEFPKVIDYCHGKHLFVLEDAAHAHGSQMNGRKAGNLADGGAFSFFPTKVMTTGEGGMITTNSDQDAALARSLRNQGKRKADFGALHEDFGNSSRITEFGALLGSIQLKKLTRLLEKRKAAYNRIASLLDGAKIEYVRADHMDAASHYKMIVLLPERISREEAEKKLAEHGVFAGGTVYQIPCHRQPVFKGICETKRYPNAEKWCPRHICPPLTSGMTEEEAIQVGRSICEVFSSK